MNWTTVALIGIGAVVLVALVFAALYALVFRAMWREMGDDR